MFPVGKLSKETASHTSTIVDLSLEVFKTFGARHQWACGEVGNTEPAGVRLFVFPFLLPIFCSFVEEDQEVVVCVCVFGLWPFPLQLLTLGIQGKKEGSGYR